MWVGPANKADYSPERRKEFRWFYDYSGGKMTDWGAHHIDIAQWALGHDHTGPVKVSLDERPSSRRSCPTSSIGSPTSPARPSSPTAITPPPSSTSTWNMPTARRSPSTTNTCREDGKTKFDNGILFEGDDGRIFVNRERLTGKPVEDMTDAERVTMHQSMIPLYKGSWPGDHMGNFFDCVEDRSEPISDVDTHHPHDDLLPPVQHRADARPRAEVGPDKRAIRRRRTSHRLHVPPPPRRLFAGGDDLTARPCEPAFQALTIVGVIHSFN